MTADRVPAGEAAASTAPTDASSLSSSAPAGMTVEQAFDVLREGLTMGSYCGPRYGDAVEVLAREHERLRGLGRRVPADTTVWLVLASGGEEGGWIINALFSTRHRALEFAATVPHEVHLSERALDDVSTWAASRSHVNIGAYSITRKVLLEEGLDFAVSETAAPAVSGGMTADEAVDVLRSTYLGHGRAATEVLAAELERLRKDRGFVYVREPQLAEALEAAERDLAVARQENERLTEALRELDVVHARLIAAVTPKHPGWVTYPSEEYDALFSAWHSATRRCRLLLGPNQHAEPNARAVLGGEEPARCEFCGGVDTHGHHGTRPGDCQDPIRGEEPARTEGQRR